MGAVAGRALLGAGPTLPRAWGMETGAGGIATYGLATYGLATYGLATRGIDTGGIKTGTALIFVTPLSRIELTFDRTYV